MRDDTSGSLPAFELNYGLIPNGQLTIDASVAFDSPSGGATQFGYGDTQLSFNTCSIRGTFSLVGDLRGDTLSGSAEWNPTVVGDCGGRGMGETIAFSGVRLSAASGALRSTVVEKFIAHPSLVILFPRR